MSLVRRLSEVMQQNGSQGDAATLAILRIYGFYEDLNTHLAFIASSNLTNQKGEAQLFYP